MPDKKTTKIIFFGDVSGALGRKGVKQILPIWEKEYKPDIFIANIENLAHNKGVTPKTMEEIASTGVKIFTGGNHVWKKYDISQLAEETDYQLACPANDSRTPAKYRYQKIEINKTPLIVVSLNGQTFMDQATLDNLSNPFHKIDNLLNEFPKGSNIVVDFHAETTSDKRAMGFYLDGRVSAVLGTHTHVPTADAQILDQGTAYLTDIGMVGPFDSILGIKKEIIIDKFLSEDKIRHETPDTGQIEINAVLLEIDNGSNKAITIKHLREIIN